MLCEISSQASPPSLPRVDGLETVIGSGCDVADKAGADSRDRSFSIHPRGAGDAFAPWLVSVPCFLDVSISGSTTADGCRGVKPAIFSGMGISVIDGFGGLDGLTFCLVMDPALLLDLVSKENFLCVARALVLMLCCGYTGFRGIDAGS